MADMKDTLGSYSMNIIIFTDLIPKIFKYSWNSQVPSSFARSYPDATFKVVTRDDYYEFLGL